MTEKRKILCITGTRADYPRVKSVLKGMSNSSSIELSILVTGSHLLKKYGYSIQEVIDDGFVIDKKVSMFEGNYENGSGFSSMPFNPSYFVFHSSTPVVARTNSPLSWYTLQVLFKRNFFLAGVLPTT